MSATESELVGAARRYLMNNYGAPLAAFVSGSGSVLVEDSGREVLDFLSGIAVCSLGHCHPAVTAAIAEQAGKLIHTSNFFANEHGPEVARLIEDLLAIGEGRVFFGNSGAEANEAAIKLARRYAGEGRRRIVALDGGFHGRTFGALSATGQPAKQIPFEPLVPGFAHVPPGDVGALEAELAKGDVAAVMIEMLQGEAGVVPVPDEFVLAARELTAAHGALLILDEVQTGFGRTGEWFAFQRLGIVPDMVTLAKAIASGFPVGALFARAEVAAAFQPGDHGTTYGGQALAMAAAKATIRTLVEIDAPSMARRKGALLGEALEKLPGVAGVRGSGLLLGAMLGSPVARTVQAKAFEEGLIVNAIGDSVVRLAPPLVVTEDEMATAVQRLGAALRRAGETE
ncbi:MAG: acetylornithine transaminase [Actinomycetota bacterium]|nr:acetylornithine transaminase [Actinomycetota bacterium]